MTITYGLTSLGYTPKPFTVVRAEISASVQAKRGASTDVSDGSWIGQIIAIFSEREASLWDLGQAVYSSQDSDAATGAAEDAIAALTGTFRAPARSSTVTETLCGSPTTVVNSGSQVKTASTGALFATTAGATIGALTAWVALTSYVVGDRVTNASRCYRCITAGSSAASGGPTTTADDILDFAAHWQYLGEGTAAVDVAMASVLKDTIVAVAKDLSVIQTPVGGWSTARNLLDAVVGSTVQPDGSLRAARITQLSATGNSPADSIRAKMLRVAGVTSCTVYANDTDTVDGNGQAAHSVQALVQGGADSDIATVLADNVAGGIATVGTTTVARNDSQGVSHDWKFTRPVAVPIYIDITLKYDATRYPTDGDAEVQEALVATATANATIGHDAIAVAIGALAFTVPGVYNVPRSGSLGGTLISTTVSPTSDADIVIDAFHMATYDTSRVTVHSTAGTP